MKKCNKDNEAPSLHMQLAEIVMERGGTIGEKLKLLELLDHYKKLDRDFWTYLSWEKSNLRQERILERIDILHKNYMEG